MGELVPRQPGAEERVLARCFGGQQTPFDWLARAVSESADRVLDLACGTGSLTQRLVAPGRLTVGLDLSELHLSRALPGEGLVFVRADATRIPFASNTFDVVLTSLGLGVVADRVAFLKEVARVLRPGGVFAALTPSLRPVSLDDLRVALQLAGHLRSPSVLPGLTEFPARAMLSAAGLTKVEDARARYHFRVVNRGDAELLVSGLRPADDRSHTAAAVDFLARRSGAGPFTVPLPMRRLVAIK